MTIKIKKENDNKHTLNFKIIITISVLLIINNFIIGMLKISNNSK